MLAYLEALEQGGRYSLMVWPVHCVIGTWGHNIHGAVPKPSASGNPGSARGVAVLKGQNPLTEQYSAVRAEVPETRTIRALRPITS